MGDGRKTADLCTESLIADLFPPPPMRWQSAGAHLGRANPTPLLHPVGIRAGFRVSAQTFSGRCHVRISAVNGVRPQEKGDPSLLPCVGHTSWKGALGDSRESMAHLWKELERGCAGGISLWGAPSSSPSRPP